MFGSRYTGNRGLEAGSLIATENKNCVEKLSVVEELEVGPPLWSSGQSFWLQIQRSRVRFPALPDFSE